MARPITKKKGPNGNIRSETGDKTNITDIQQIINGYNELLYANIFDNLVEIDKFLEKNLSKVTQKK